MSFLSTLGKVVSEQFGVADNSETSLDAASGRIPDIGILGDFSKKIDQTAWRTYIENGFVRDVRPDIREVILQQPDICILVKKRMFSSLAENYRLDLLNDEEKLFIRSSKQLFKKKCQAIAAYELLSKVENVAKDAGYINSYTMPLVFNAITTLDDAGINIIDDQTRSTLQTIKQVHQFSEPNSQTTWLMDDQEPFGSALGQGTGVIELTLATSINTHVGVEFASGGASLTIEDPYALLIVTQAEIEHAIKEALSIRTGTFGTFVDTETRNLIARKKQELNALRTQRGASRIKFIVSADNLFTRKVRALLEQDILVDQMLSAEKIQDQHQRSISHGTRVW